MTFKEARAEARKMMGPWAFIYSKVVKKHRRSVVKEWFACDMIAFDTSIGTYAPESEWYYVHRDGRAVRHQDYESWEKQRKKQGFYHGNYPFHKDMPKEICV